MAGAWHCPECDDHYPKEQPFNHCPVCGTYTKASKNDQLPTVPLEEAYRRARRRQREDQFEKWLVENQWEGGTDTVHVTIYGERGKPSTREERELASRVAYSLDHVIVGGESGPMSGGPVAPVGELHVFYRA